MCLVSFRRPVLLHLVSGTRLIRGQVWYIYATTRYQVSHAQSYNTWCQVDSRTTSSAQAARAVAYNDLVRLVPRIQITLPKTNCWCTAVQSTKKQYRARKNKLGSKKARAIFSYRSKNLGSQYTEVTCENKPSAKYESQPTAVGQYSRALRYTAVLQQYKTPTCDIKGVVISKPS